MPANGQSDPDPADPKAGVDDETLQVRVRSKNPLIERRPSHRQDTDTRASDGPPSRRPDAQDTLPPPDPHTPTGSAGRHDHSGRNIDSHPNINDREIDEDETVVAVQRPNVEAAIQSAIRGEEAVTKPMLLHRALGTARGAPRRDTTSPDNRAPNNRASDSRAPATPHSDDTDDRSADFGPSAPIDNLTGLLIEPQMRSLQLILSGGLDQPGMDGASSPKRALEHLVLDRPYADLSPREQALVLGAIATHPRDIATTKAAIAIMKTGILEVLHTEARSRFLELFLALASIPRALLARLGARRIAHDVSAATATDTEQTWIIESLRQLAEIEAPIDSPASPGIVGSDCMIQTLTHITQPETMPLEDGFGGHVLAIEFALALLDPAEYARHAVLAAHMRRQNRGQESEAPLTSTQGPVPGAGSTPTSPPPLRRAFLAIAAHTDELAATNKRTAARDHAADVAAVLRLATTIYGRPYVALNGEPLSALLEQLATSTPHSAAASAPRAAAPQAAASGTASLSSASGLASASSAASNANTGVGSAMNSSSGAFLQAETRARTPIFVAIEHRRGDRLFLIDHVDATHLYLRAPHGRSSKRQGATREAPRREVVDPASGLERIPLVMARQWARYAIAPTNLAGSEV